MAKPEMPRLQQVRANLSEVANEQIARSLQRFFKTRPGEYGEGDRFLGIRVPHLRKLARAHRSLDRSGVLELLHSQWHEERMLALLIMVEQFRRGSDADREGIYRMYLENTDHINNWDLVDTSAEHVVGGYLSPENMAPLRLLADSSSIWERRIAIMSTFAWIRRGTFGPTLEIAERLLGDSHDLIHKAVGWMLREVGNRDREVEETFLRKHQRHMPRTMLRYAIERFPPELRRQYMKGEFAPPV